jgi:uncharacterized protein involved in exopolysaccharide biosynthesis
MALTPVTPRDRLQRLVDLGRKTLRYWWLVAVFAVAGGGLSLAFALLKPRTYQSWSTVFYQERIRSSVLMPGQEEIALRNIGDKYRELLVARSQLEKIIADPELDPFPDESNLDMKLDKLRQAVKLESRGGNAFRIVYGDADPDRAKRVAEKLTTLLQQKDEELRNTTARATVEFVTRQKEEAATELRVHEQELAGFLAQHPEFAQETQPGQAEGASIRAIRDAQKKTPQNPRLLALERQRQRIQIRLDAPPDAPPVRIQAPPSQERILAEAAVSEAQRELSAANRELESAMTKYTELHPTVKAAKERVTQAQQRLRHAQAAVPAEIETIVAPATAEDRVKLQRELQKLDQQITELQRGGKSDAVVDTTTKRVVELETRHAELRRRVTEQREQVNALAAGVFRAQIDASQKLAEAGSRLEIVDPAFRPVRPSGPGKTIFLMAGMALFLSLGVGLAIGLAVIDDRLYRREDVDQLGIAVLGVIPPATVVKRRRVQRKETQS